MKPSHEQHVVVYDSPKGKALVYDTCYTEGQIQRAVVRCVSTYGKRANVRSMTA